MRDPLAFSQKNQVSSVWLETHGQLQVASGTEPALAAFYIATQAKLHMFAPVDHRAKLHLPEVIDRQEPFELTSAAAGDLHKTQRSLVGVLDEVV